MSISRNPRDELLAGAADRGLEVNSDAVGFNLDLTGAIGLEFVDDVLVPVPSRTFVGE